MSPQPPTPSSPRYDRLDALRGAAVLWMAGFHFCFDLALFRFTTQNFYLDPFWTTQRTLIVSLFLLCAGAGQALAHAQGLPWPRFWRRWVQVLACALLVSVGSAWMFPASWISFGVLHGMAVMLILARLTAGWGGWLWLLGLLAIGLPWVIEHPWFDSRSTNWIGLVTHKPVTEDFVPLLPWMGVVWWGVAATQELLDRRKGVLSGGLPQAMRPLAALGRWSLSFYMIHQPVLIGTLMAWQSLHKS